MLKEILHYFKVIKKCRPSTLLFISTYSALLILAGDIRLPNDKPLFSHVISIHTCAAYERMHEFFYRFDTLANTYAMVRMAKMAFVPESTTFLAYERSMAPECETFKSNLGNISSDIGTRASAVGKHIFGIFVKWPGFDLIADIVSLGFNCVLFVIFSIFYFIQYILIHLLGIILFVPHGLVNATAMIFMVHNYWVLLFCLYAVYIMLFFTPMWFIIDHEDAIKQMKKSIEEDSGVVETSSDGVTLSSLKKDK